MYLFHKEIKKNNIPQIFNSKQRNNIQLPYLLNYTKNKALIDRKENDKIAPLKKNKGNISLHKKLFLTNEDDIIFLNNKKINSRKKIRINNNQETDIKNNKLNNNINHHEREKINRQTKYSIYLRSRINENIKGAKILKNPYLFIPLISKKNELNTFNKKNIYKTINEKEKYRRKNRFSNFGKMILLNNNEKSRNRIKESKKNFNKKSPYKINNNFKNGNKIKNNLGMNIFNSQGGERIFKKEEYSDMVRIRNGRKYKKQRERKFRNYLNKIENAPKNIELNKIYHKNEMDKDYNENSEEEEEEEEDDEEEDEDDEDDEDEEDEEEEDENNSSNDSDDSNEDSDISNESINDEIIDNLNTIKLKEIEKLSHENKKCVICLENFVIDDDCICLPCIHIYHGECIKKWLKRRNFCPICRFKITSENIKKNINQENI